MTSTNLDGFAEVWCLDFEFFQPTGELPRPLCLVAKEWRTGRLVRLWEDEFGATAPFSAGPENLFVAYYASAEIGCYLSLEWEVPQRVLDLFCEFRCATNGLAPPHGSGLLGALSWHGLDAIDGLEKDSMRSLAMRGGAYSPEERAALLDYCETDTQSLCRLLPKMLDGLDLGRALLRGRYMAAAAAMERCGVPIDTAMLAEFREHWDEIKRRATLEVDRDFGVFVPTSSRRINPETRRGAALLDTAKRHDVDPLLLADAADDLWRRDRELQRDSTEAVRAARLATGLTVKTISRWEQAGRDHSIYPELDVQARELASEFPALGLGPGYVSDGVVDDIDYAGALWDRLREDDEAFRPRHDLDLLDEAAALVADADGYVPAGPLSFSAARFADWLVESGIPWPRLDSGVLDLSDKAFRQMAKQWPQVSPLRELRHTLSQMRLNDLAVGSDGRNRCLLSAFRARTSRNQPSNAKSIFGPSVWLRGLIAPEPGRAIAYVDWSQQEFGISAALSNDAAMMEAYSSGDPYLTFAQQAGAAPAGATKETHGDVRGRFKICALAVQYGMGAKSLAEQIGDSEAAARRLLALHRRTFLDFWKWSEGAVTRAMLHCSLWTVFGWRIRVGPDTNPRSLANFPVQSNGAEMLRLAACLAVERGIAVCMPVHDAILVEGASATIEDVVAETQRAMQEASEVVLSGFQLRSDCEIVRHPGRYSDPRGERMWSVVAGVLGSLREHGAETEVGFD